MKKTCETHKLNNQLVSRMRLERMTLWLKVKCSTNWANETNIIIKMAASGGFEPPECQSQSLMPYHLATRQSKVVEGHGFEPWNPKEQIYSLPRLTTSLSSHYINGADRGNRTPNLLITSQLRYQLRYVGKNGGRCRTRTYDPLLVRQVL